MRPRTSHHAPDTLAPAAHWADDAACRTSKTPDVWFAEEHDAGSASMRHMAKQVCARCPAIASCLRDAIERGEKHGVWGGLDTAERNALVLYRRKESAEEGSSGGPSACQTTAA